MNDMTRNALVQITIPSLAMQESELTLVLQNSVYPGAKIESIKLVIGYCRAQNLDPMLKPVHIVPMDVPTGKKDSDGWDIKEKRDVVMPGIGLYRIQASRSGEHAGTSEPEFGPDKTMKLGETDITFPEWCRVTVRRRATNGVVADYTAVERWTENYATKARNKKDPNTMWAKRPYAQLAKCAEAQALRKAFPEIGGQPTAEEMEGKQIEDAPVIDAGTGALVPQPQTRADPPRATATTVDGEARREPEQEAGKPAAQAEDRPIAEGQLRILRAKMKHHALTDLDLCAAFKVEKVEDLRYSQFEDVQAWITEK